MTGVVTIIGATLPAWIGLWFLISATGKTRHRSRIEHELGSYTVVPRSRAIVLSLIAAEVAIGIGAIAGPLQVSMVGGAILMTTSALAMSVDLLRGIRHACGCGSAKRQISWRLAGRNLAVGAVALVLAVIEPTPGIEIRLLGLVQAATTFAVLEAMRSFVATRRARTLVPGPLVQ